MKTVHLLIPLSEINNAIFFVDLKLLNTIRQITNKGTLRNIPVSPHNFPINERVSIIIKGLIFSDLPSSFGSKMFPIKIWIANNKNSIINGSKKLRN